ncbi:hypothetical protein BKA70DRAFT_1450518 [Coprinopsis sp. MPI-PUGE-AT-0042]|nr:hypothetical protein BKA70DRAFT_1450518 [Coprinopsis sp. MPI-PUGE-AT-0042]
MSTLSPFRKGSNSISSGHIVCIVCRCMDNRESSTILSRHPSAYQQRGGCQPDSNGHHQDCNKGCSESHPKGVISEEKVLLNGKPCDSFKVARTIFCLTPYLTEVKSNLRNARQQNQDLSRQYKALMEERELLLVKVKAQVKKREQEQKQALDVELNLREHCSKAHEAYERMVDQYNYVAKEWSSMNEEIKKLCLARNGDRSVPASWVPLFERGAILISPLPEFTTNSAFKPLPCVDKEEEEESYDGSEEHNGEEDTDTDILQPIMDSTNPERFTHVNQPAVIPTQDFFRDPNPSELSRTAPYLEAQCGGRSRSHSILPICLTYSSNSLNFMFEAPSAAISIVARTLPGAHPSSSSTNAFVTPSSMPSIPIFFLMQLSLDHPPACFKTEPGQRFQPPPPVSGNFREDSAHAVALSESNAHPASQGQHLTSFHSTFLLAAVDAARVHSIRASEESGGLPGVETVALCLPPIPADVPSPSSLTINLGHGH